MLSCASRLRLRYPTRLCLDRRFPFRSRPHTSSRLDAIKRKLFSIRIRTTCPIRAGPFRSSARKCRRIPTPFTIGRLCKVIDTLTTPLFRRRTLLHRPQVTLPVIPQTPSSTLNISQTPSSRATNSCLATTLMVSRPRGINLLSSATLGTTRHGTLQTTAPGLTTSTSTHLPTTLCELLLWCALITLLVPLLLCPSLPVVPR